MWRGQEGGVAAPEQVSQRGGRLCDTQAGRGSPSKPASGDPRSALAVMAQLTCPTAPALTPNLPALRPASFPAPAWGTP